MPIYEFYCPDCHTVYNFYSRRINTDKVPVCPVAGENHRLRRQVSLFAISKGREEKEGDDMLDNLDDDRLEKAMMSMAGEMENLDENDPRQAARMMRRLFDTTGLKLSGGMEEAISRMEAGEDAEQIEAEMGDMLEEEEPFAVKPRKLMDDLRRRYLPPKVDETLYDL
ncbi:MAG: zinc ribbon domain-containing protein [Arenicellales bacterium]|jgi:putative FmdB family regulatory protein